MSHANTDYTDYFLDRFGQRDYSKLNFFDECIVIVTYQEIECAVIPILVNL